MRISFPLAELGDFVDATHPILTPGYMKGLVINWLISVIETVTINLIGQMHRGAPG